MNSTPAPNIDATQFAGAAYQSLRGLDNTLVAQVGYQSILSSAVAEPEPERHKLGDMIAGRYEVLAIHQGSMGVVYGTFDHEEKLPRALKTLQHRFAESKSMLDLFKEEAAIWVRLEKHPFIVRAYLVQNIEAQPYVITEYIRGQAGMGGDLRAWLGNPKLTLPLAVEMALQIAQGMQHAVQKIPGMVHRDLKPANILVDERGRAMVTDFGLVYAAESSAGTPAYMAPEQWHGGPLDPRTDVYAFGCVLYEMFTGYRMYAADSVEEWKAAHLSLSPVPPRALNLALPLELEALVLRCLVKEMGARPGSWDEVVAECARWFHQLTGQPAVLEFTAYDLTVSELIIAGYSLNQLGKHREGIEIYDRVPVADPNYKIALQGKGMALEDLGFNEKAMVVYDHVLAIDPNYTEAWNRKGNALNRLGCNEEAVEAYERALAIDPNYSTAWNNMGNALYALGRNEEAVASYDRALDIDLNNDGSWCGKAAALGSLGRNEEAVAACERALALAPNSAVSWLNKGNALNDLGRVEEAVAAYDTALAINPNFARAWNNKGSVLSDFGRNSEALDCYERALAINPNFADTWVNKGLSFEVLGRNEESLAAYIRALTIDPNNKIAWNNKGNALKALGFKEEAITAYNRALAIAPNFEAALNMGNVLCALGRYEVAVAAYDRALAIDPDNKGAWNNKGVALKNLGQIEGAVEAYDRALALDPNFAMAWNNRVSALKALGQHADA